MEIVRLLKKDKKRFAKAVGVDVSTVYRWLGGVCSPNFDELLAIKRITSDNGDELLHFFSDLISERATKSPDEARVYINGLRSVRMWREVFK
ncbi:MAG: hypothetical protein PHX44_01355 [Sulfurimonas sp.]|uniref:hypothetical protein n=1 Tax=Sulfurimonas sp. TaxID=2022749 RepID=UPI00261ECEAD|nr:hypothetical protein [Sulfurimonas sp.]MDD2651680.1 hypothetical protein [Sulfurimonas sp.]MDD3451491.1 hypothetical protein [Sulfurimonas sp.]